MNKHLFSRYLIVLCLSLTLATCKSTKGLFADKDAKNSLKQALAKVEAERVDYESVAIVGRANVEVPSQKLKVGLSYRLNMYADSLIWLRISKLGIEGARILITKDSIFAIDRANNQIHVSDFSLAEKYTGLSADFEILEDLFLGNLHLIPAYNSMGLDNKNDNIHIFNGRKSDTDFSYAINQSLQKLIAMEVIKLGDSLHTKVSYSNFEKYGGTQMPQRTEIEIIAPEPMKIEFNHRRVDINPERISFKFNMPRSYERVVYD